MPKKRNQEVALVLSCEHGGNRVPAAYRALFRGAKQELESHRGWDPGSLDLARTISHATGAPLVATTVSRLVVECNRSVAHPKLFSQFTRGLSRDARTRALNLYYHPHRGAVEAVVKSALRTHARVVHIGVHTFTPVLNGRTRTADVGLLYDPKRKEEAIFADLWMHALHWEAPLLRVKKNYPYRGWTDGLTTTLRAKFGARRYVGIELEVNQALALGPTRRWSDPANRIARSLALLFGT
ncbi:MAG TPA: N-formylglutamate amidohydrolase [Candidatus Krumholzibacteria bacterium]|nr:N-formylglutamate amidohydrolase [Candidatus Krumholzibacteria bacterium]